MNLFGERLDETFVFKFSAYFAQVPRAWTKFIADKALARYWLTVGLK